MSNGNGVPHRVLDQMAKFEAKWSGKLAEVVNKHNELAAQLTAIEGLVKNVAAFTASEMGKMGGTVERNLGYLQQAIQGIDLNTLAVGELAKELTGQLTQIDRLFARIAEKSPELSLDFSDEEIEGIKEESSERYTEWVSSAFNRVRERLQKEDAERQAAQQQAKEAAEKAAAAQAEAQTVEEELKKASVDERGVVTATSGGPGTAFPDGADIFGG